LVPRGKITETFLADSTAMHFPQILRRNAALCAAALMLGLYGWAMLATTAAGHDGAIGPAANALGADWVIWQSAARAFFTHDLKHIYDQFWITRTVNAEYAGWLSSPLPYPVFPYPPVTLLLVVPFAGLPMPLSMLAFELVSFAGLALALKRLAPDRAMTLFFLCGAILCPAASNNVLAGQNGFLTAALICGGMAMLETRPGIAGALFGLMIVKPQFFPLLPVALIAARQGRALAATAAMALSLVLVSAAVLGRDVWIDWLATFLHPQTGSGINGNAWGHMWDESVSTCVTLLGGPQWLATTAQAAAAFIALAAVWRAFRSNLGMPARLGVLLCAVLLASPHLSPYDMELLAVAGMLYVSRLPQDARPMLLLLPLAAWIAPLCNPPRANPLGFATPLILIGLMVALFGGFRPKTVSSGACEAFPKPV
jgi:alpha-1,2-mannosyltransferase